MKKILIDTDVLLDFFFDRKPHSDNSTIILSLCERGILEGYILEDKYLWYKLIRVLVICSQLLDFSLGITV